ncbi:hypothetical protein YQE_05864, partial [Dendroctonus ponderosae]
MAKIICILKYKIRRNTRVAYHTKQSRRPLDDTTQQITHETVTQKAPTSELADEYTSPVRKHSDAEETHEFVTRFKSTPDSEEAAQVVTKRTILKKKHKKGHEGDTVIEEIISESTPQKIDKTGPTIEELSDTESEPQPNEYTVEEMPESPTPKKKKSVKHMGGRPERGDIVTVDEAISEQPKFIVEELPEQIEETTVVEDGIPRKKVVRKRVIKKKKDGKQETTEITTVEQEGKKPETTISVQEKELCEEPEYVVEELPQQIEETIPEYIVEELPEQIEEKTVVEEGIPRKKVIKKRVIKKKKGDKQETTEIVTVEQEGKKPEITITVEEEQVPEQPEYVVEELPEQIEETTVVEDGIRRKKVIKKRVIKKKKGDKQETTRIVTVEQEGKKPETTITVDEEQTPKQPEYVIEELPEQIEETTVVEEGIPRKKVIKKRVIKKKKGDKQETTQIVTVEQEGKKPETTITVDEEQTPEQPEYVIEELPEQIEESTVVEGGISRKKVVKKRVIKKKKGDKQETTKIVTIEQEGKKPETTITVEEEQVPEQPEYIVEELPEQIEETTVVEDGIPIKKVTKKRVIKKKKGVKQETTEIVTVEQEGKKPETTITVNEEQVPDQPEYVVEELPEQIEETTVVEEGVPRQKVVRKRVIKKKKGDKQETTEIVTVEQEGKKPQMTISVEEKEIPHEQEYLIEELPEQIEETTVVEEGVPRQKVVRKRVIKKKRGGKQETTKIITVEQEGKKPETTITVEEEQVPEQPEYIVEELPEQIEETIVVEEGIPRRKIEETTVVEEGIPRKKVTKKRVIKKKKGDKQETTEIVTVEQEGKKPETTITVEEEQVPEQPEYVVEELPEQIEETIVVEEGIPRRKVVKKRVIKKKKGDKQETTKIVTVEQEGKRPETTVTVEEEQMPKQPEYIVEELPEQIEQTTVVEEGIPRKRVVKKRVIKRKKGNKQEKTEIITVEQEGKEPKTTVTVEEVEEDESRYVAEEIPEKVPTKAVEIDQPKKKVRKSKKPISEDAYLFVPLLEQQKDLPTTPEIFELLKMEVIRILLAHPLPQFPELTDMPTGYRVLVEYPEEKEEIDLGDGRKGTIRKRKIKKRIGDTDEVITISIKEKPDEEPTIKGNIQEENASEIEDMSEMVPVIEIPEETEVVDMTTSDDIPKKKITKKRKLLKKIGPKIEETEVISVFEDGKRPKTTVKIKEYDIDATPKEITLVKHKLELIDIKPKQPVIVEKDDIPKLTELKLRKPKRPQKAAEEKKQPMFRLKSRIKLIIFPPLSEVEQHGIITNLPAYIRDHGELSRNISDAQKVLKKKKIRKFKDIDYMPPELEEVEHVDMPAKPETTDAKDSPKHKRLPKERQQPDEKTAILELGKGQIPEDVELPEKVLLKKIPETASDKEPLEVKEAKTKKPDESKIKNRSEEHDEEPIAFEPYDIDKTDFEMEDFETSDKDDVQKIKKKVPTKYKKKPKAKSSPDVDELQLIMGVPKEKPDIESEDVSFQPKQKPKREEEPEKIKLKPFKVPKYEGPAEKVRLEGPEYQKPIVVYELPEVITTVDEKTPEGIKKTIKKRRTIKKRLGPTQEVTNIETLIPEQGKSETIVTTEIEYITDEFVVPYDAAEVIELPTEEKIIKTKVNDKVITKKFTKRKLKKPIGKSQSEITEILTVDEDEKKPQVLVVIYTVEEDLLPDQEEADELLPLLKVRPKKGKPLVVELPEEVVVEEVKVDKNTTKTVIKNKKQYKKLHKPKEEIITLQTREIDGDSQTDVTIEELVPDDISDILKGEVLEELPSTTEITEDLSGPTPIVTKVTKRKTQKRVGEKAQVTEIVVTEKGNETPITEVNVYLTDEVPRVTEESVDTITIEVPEEITTKVIQTPTGPKIETTKTRILKKLKSPKQETLIVETVYEEDKIPETTVTADEAKDLSALPESTQVLEVPEKITIDKTSKKTMKRIIHKKKGDKIETTKICTVEEDDRKPQTTVTTFTSEISELPPDETLKLLEVLTPKKLKKKPITPHFELETTDVHTIEHTQELGEVSEDLPKVIGTVIQDSLSKP